MALVGFEDLLGRKVSGLGKRKYLLNGNVYHSLRFRFGTQKKARARSDDAARLY